MPQTYNIIVTTPLALLTYTKSLITIWHKNLTVVKFYGSPFNHLDEKLLGF